MQRDVYKRLKEWIDRTDRVPLIIRGARQVGKSWLVRKLGESFDTFVELNFEKNKSLKQSFQGDVDIPKLLERLSLYFGVSIKPGRTLLFLDEVQECPEAIEYLRYFKEELPELHVIAAGSLLDFLLQKVGLPVGRVEFLYVCPLSFGEFLSVSGRQDLRKHLFKQENDAALGNVLAKLLRTYIWLGGMPEVVANWIEYNDPMQCQRIQDRVLTAYKADFHKYAQKQQIEHIDKVFEHIPLQTGSKFKYVDVDRDLRSTLLKEALLCLDKAGIAQICYHSSSQRPPLGAGTDRRRFKVFFFDVGLAQRLIGMTHQDWVLNDAHVEKLGALAEQFVAQELIAYRSAEEKAELYYWHREAKNSNAEVDFVTTRQGKLVPIEVKAGKGGRMRSMHVYLEEHPESELGLKIADGEFGLHGKLQEIPLYGIESWLKQAT